VIAGTPRSASHRQRGPFVALCAASSISLVGNELTAIALPWLVLTRLGTAFDTGLVGAAVVIPAVIGAVAGGVVVDRLGGRRASIAADVTSALAVAAIPVSALTFGLSVPLVLVFAFLGALLDAPGQTARQVLVPDVAERAGIGLDRANALFQATQNVSLLVGPIAAGVIIVAVGPTNALWFDAASFVVSAAIVALAVPRTAAVASDEQVADVLAGIRLVARDALLGGMTLVAAIANFVFTPFFVVLLPTFALQSGLDAGTLGLLVAAVAGGTVVGSIAYGIAGSRVPRRPTMAIGAVGTGLGIAVVALGPPIPVVIGALAFAGFSVGPVNPIAFTIMQERVPPELRGRAFGAILGGILVAAPLGMIAFGALTDAKGPTTGLAVVAGAFLLVAALVALWPAFDGMNEAPQA
jgi:MFS family permease